MTNPPPPSIRVAAFDTVEDLGLTLPGVRVAIKYDGSPVLRVDGMFMAGLATHPSADPDTLVVRSGFEERGWLLAEAPETYYLTDYYRKHPVVLVRLSRLEQSALHDLLSVSWRMTKRKDAQRAPVAFNIATAGGAGAIVNRRTCLRPFRKPLQDGRR